MTALPGACIICGCTNPREVKFSEVDKGFMCTSRERCMNRLNLRHKVHSTTKKIPFDDASYFSDGDPVHFRKLDRKGYTDAYVLWINHGKVTVREVKTEKIVHLDPKETNIIPGHAPKEGGFGKRKGGGPDNYSPSPWTNYTGRG